MQKLLKIFGEPQNENLSIPDAPVLNHLCQCKMLKVQTELVDAINEMNQSNFGISYMMRITNIPFKNFHTTVPEPEKSGSRTSPCGCFTWCTCEMSNVQI